jgi:hypothetical protein
MPLSVCPSARTLAALFLGAGVLSHAGDARAATYTHGWENETNSSPAYASPGGNGVNLYVGGSAYSYSATWAASFAPGTGWTNGVISNYTLSNTNPYGYSAGPM